MSSIAIRVEVTEEVAEIARAVAKILAPHTNRVNATVMGLLLANICADEPSFISIYAQIIEKVAEAQLALFAKQHYEGAIQ